MKPTTRREFLRTAGRTTAACAGLSVGGLMPTLARGAVDGSPATLPALINKPSSPQVDPSLKSIVADLHAKEVAADAIINETLLGEMIDESVRLATHTASAGEGWNRIIKPDEVVGIKFNRIGCETIGTTLPFGTQLVESLKRADISPKRIILIEAPEKLIRDTKTRPCPFGFSGPKVSFGSGEDELVAVLQEIGAIINVPFLKTHNIAQMTCCLKNLSHALIRSPKLCHANGCAPFVGDILSIPQIRSKLRLHVVNALRIVFDGGPLPVPDALVTHSGILVSADPVAVDYVATDLLNEYRAKRKLPAIGDRDGHVPHVHAAGARGLGTDDQDYIQILRPTLF